MNLGGLAFDCSLTVVRITGRAPGGLRFELPLAAYRSGDRVVDYAPRRSAWTA